MLRTIIYIIVILPIIQFVIRFLAKGNTKEKYDGIVRFPKAYFNLVQICAVVTALCGVVLGLRFGWESSLLHLIFIAVMIFVFEVVGMVFVCYKVAVYEKDFVVYKFLKRQKKYEYNQVDEAVIAARKELHVFVKGKKVVNVDGSALGRKEFQKILEENMVTIRVEEINK